jgi:hypothetical protein
MPVDYKGDSRNDARPLACLGRVVPESIRDPTIQAIAIRIEMYHNSGDLWVVNQHLYADDSINKSATATRRTTWQTTPGTCTSSTISPTAVRTAAGTAPPTSTTRRTAARANWASSMGYNGTTISVPASITSNASDHRYLNPLFSSPPPLRPAAPLGQRRTNPTDVGAYQS